MKFITTKLGTYAGDIIKGVVSDEASVEVHEVHEGGGAVVEVLVALSDAGKAISRKGEISEAARKLIHAFARKHGIGRVLFQVSAKS